MSATPVRARPLPPERPTRKGLVLAVLCLSLVMVTLDNTILNVALPRLSEDLGASTSQLQWIVDSYVLVFAALLLTAGSLGDRFGRRGTLGAGLGMFAAGSVLSALATSPDQLIVTRGVMGVGAAFVFPATLSILTNVYTDSAERARAIAIWSGTAGLGIALGPIAGGWLLEHFWWGSIFMVNLPIVAAALVGGRRWVPTSRHHDAPRTDVRGVALSAVGLVALVGTIIEGPVRGWTSATTLGGFILAAVVLAAFVAWERRTPDPLVDLRVFRNPRFTAASLAVTFIYFCLFGTLFYLTQHLQFLLGYDPLQAGVRVLPFSLVLLPTAMATPKVVGRFGTKRVVTAGLAFIAISLALRATATLTTGYPLLLVTSALFAFGMGLAIAPCTASIMAAVPAEQAGVGSAINDTTRQIGGALGVAVLGSLFASSFRTSFDQHLHGVQVPAAVREAGANGIGPALRVATRVGGPAGDQVTLAARQAFVHSADLACWVAAGVALVGGLLALRFLPTVTGRRDHEAVVDQPAVELAVAELV